MPSSATIAILLDEKKCTTMNLSQNNVELREKWSRQSFQVGEFESCVNGRTNISSPTMSIGLLIGAGIKCHAILNVANVVRFNNFLFRRLYSIIHSYYSPSWPDHTWSSIVCIFDIPKILQFCKNRSLLIAFFHQWWMAIPCVDILKIICAFFYSKLFTLFLENLFLEIYSE